MADDEATVGPITRVQRSISAILGRPTPEATTPQYLAPKTINPCRDEAVILTKIKLGRTYIRCKDLTQALTAQRGCKRTLHCWNWGEDLRLKDGIIRQLDVYYCYLCEREERKQMLPVVSSGRATTVDHLIKAHQMDKTTGMICTHHKAPPAGQATLDNIGEYGQ
jgi:superfamily II DNA or RNA helicase